MSNPSIPPNGVPPGAGFGYTFSGWAIFSMIVLNGFIWLGCWEFVPPPSPALSAEEVALIFREQAFGIRLGTALYMLAIALGMLCITTTSAAMKRMYGSYNTLVFANLLIGGGGLLITNIAAIFWGAAAFRPDQPAAQIQMLNDLGWLLFLLPAPTVALANAALGVATLLDDPQKPVFPRWYGYFCLFVAAFSISSIVTGMFRTGPFSWTGLFGFYVPMTIAFMWLPVTAVLFLKLGGRISRGELSCPSR